MKAILLAAAAEGEEPNPLIPHLPEIIWGLIFFVALVALMTKFVVPNFEKAYAARTAEIEGGIEEAKAAFRITGITVGPDGKVTVDTSKARDGAFNGKVEINGARAVDGSYDLPEESPDARFFKAFLRP